MPDMFAGFKCSPENQEMISTELIDSLGINPAEMYSSVDNIVKIASEASRAKGVDFALTPFCHTLEAMAMGANIRPADATAGPRAGAYVAEGLDYFLNLPKNLRVADLPEAKNVLEACGILRRDGWKVVYQLTGPIALMSCMMDLGVLFKAWRRTPDTVEAVLDRLMPMLTEFAAEAIDAGADFISYSDPVGSRDILGPKMGRSLTENFTKPIVRRLIDICDGLAATKCADRPSTDASRAVAQRKCGDKATLLLCPLSVSLLGSCDAAEMADSDGSNGEFTGICVKRAGSTGNYKNIRLTA